MHTHPTDILLRLSRIERPPEIWFDQMQPRINQTSPRVFTRRPSILLQPWDQLTDAAFWTTQLDLTASRPLLQVRRVGIASDMSVTIGPRLGSDEAEIEELLDQAFGVDRHRKLSYSYRIGLDPLWSLSLSARVSGRLIGTISAWPVAVGASPDPALLLGADRDRRGCEGNWAG